jgi:hypothetical protein
MQHRQVIYCSQLAIASERVSDEIAAILRSARRRNAALGVTGCLAYNSRWFAQVVEGPPEAVQSLVSVISRDKRHVEFHIMLDRPIRARSFPDWSMINIDMAQTGPFGMEPEPFEPKRMLPTMLLMRLMQAAEQKTQAA